MSEQSDRMEVVVDLSKPQNRRADPATSRTEAMRKIQSNPSKMSSKGSKVDTQELRNLYDTFDQGKISKEQLYDKLVYEFSYSPSAELRKCMVSNDITYSKLLQSVSKTPNAQMPNQKMPSFSDKKLTMVNTTPGSEKNRYNRVINSIQDFQTGKMSKSQFRNYLMEENITVDEEVNRAIDKCNSVGVSYKQLNSVITSRLQSEQQEYQLQKTKPMPSVKIGKPQAAQQSQVTEAQFAIDNYQTKNRSAKSARDKPGPRVQQLRKLYSGTSDLLSWNKRTEEENSLANRKKFHKPINQGADIFHPASDSWQENTQKTNPSSNKKQNLAGAGDILTWSGSNEPEVMSNKQEFATRSTLYRQ